MIIKVKKGATPTDIEKALDRLSKGKKRPTLKRHFGVLKRGLDGLAYQKSARREN